MKELDLSSVFPREHKTYCGNDLCDRLIDQTAETLQAYKYNGKELDRTYGLDLYDYSARYMDGALERFTTMDPLAEKYYSVSPYAYCLNNPLKFVDPDGKDGIIAIKGNQINISSNIYLLV